MLMNLESLCPKQKLKDFENIKKIVQSHENLEEREKVKWIDSEIIKSVFNTIYYINLSSFKSDNSMFDNFFAKKPIQSFTDLVD